MSDAQKAVIAGGEAARDSAASLARAADDVINQALRAMAARLTGQAPEILAANAEDMADGQAAGLGQGLLDRLRLDPGRMQEMARQIGLLADAPFPPGMTPLGDLPGGPSGGRLRLAERRVPVGVIGANFEARPNVTIDIASQLLKSRNAGVLRTGGAALRSAAALTDHVIAPAVQDAGLDPRVVQLVRSADREAAVELVRQPGLIPLVILRGSGESTRALAREAALHGVRTLAHADGGAVIYLDSSADRALALQLIETSLDRLGVCNRLNLLLVQQETWEVMVPLVTKLAERLGVALSLPPHQHPLGLEWALEPGSEATITVAAAAGATDAAEIANTETSGLAAAIVAEDAAAAGRFLDAYAGTGAFWNASPRLLDGFKLLSVPETGINIDAVPGPRGPVTFRDLYLRQYVVVPRRPAF